MSARERAGGSAAIRRLVGRALVAGLTLAALTASAALLSGSFDDTDARVIGTSIGFSVFSAVAAAGAAARLRNRPPERLLGTVCVAASALGFLFLVIGVWGDVDADWPWEVFGCAGLVALGTSHACLVLGARRPSDGPAIRALTTASVVLAVIDSAVGILAILEVLDEIDEGLAQLVGVTLIALLLSTVLPPILRRVGSEREEPAAEDPAAREMLAIADRIEELCAAPAESRPEIRREAQRLRKAAQRR